MTNYRFVDTLPDLIAATEYAEHPTGGLMRFRIRVTTEGVEILGDAMRPIPLERLLATLGPEVIERMLCG